MQRVSLSPAGLPFRIFFFFTVGWILFPAGDDVVPTVGTGAPEVDGHFLP